MNLLAVLIATLLLPGDAMQTPVYFLAIYHRQRLPRGFIFWSYCLHYTYVHQKWTPHRPWPMHRLSQTAVSLVHWSTDWDQLRPPKRRVLRPKDIQLPKFRLRIGSYGICIRHNWVDSVALPIFFGGGGGAPWARNHNGHPWKKLWTFKKLHTEILYITLGNLTPVAAYHSGRSFTGSAASVGMDVCL